MHQIVKKGSNRYKTYSADLKSDRLDHKALVAISIGDPALITGGSAALFYGAIATGIIASLFAWWYANRKKTNKKGRTGSPSFVE